MVGCRCCLIFCCQPQSSGSPSLQLLADTTEPVLRRARMSVTMRFAQCPFPKLLPFLSTPVAYAVTGNDVAGIPSEKTWLLAMVVALILSISPFGIGLTVYTGSSTLPPTLGAGLTSHGSSSRSTGLRHLMTRWKPSRMLARATTNIHQTSQTRTPDTDVWKEKRAGADGKVYSLIPKTIPMIVCRPMPPPSPIHAEPPSIAVGVQDACRVEVGVTEGMGTVDNATCIRDAELKCEGLGSDGRLYCSCITSTPPF